MNFESVFQRMSHGAALHELVFAPNGHAVDYRILETNASFERHTGISALQVRGHLASEAYGTGSAPYLDKYEAAVRTGTSISFETFFPPLHKYFEISICPSEPHCFATVFTDVSDRKIAEEERSRSSGFVRSANDAIITRSLDGRVLIWNRAAERLYGYSEAEMLGKSSVLLTTIDCVAEMDLIERQLKQTLLAKYFEAVRLRKDGSRFLAAVTLSPVMDPRGQLSGTSAIERDITEQRRLDALLGKSQQAEAVAKLAAHLAHEINTPAQFMGDNTKFLQDAFHALCRLLRDHKELLEAANHDSVTPELLARCRLEMEKSEPAFLLEQVPLALSQNLEGVEQIAKIGRAMNQFSHAPPNDEWIAELTRPVDSNVPWLSRSRNLSGLSSISAGPC